MRNNKINISNRLIIFLLITFIVSFTSSQNYFNKKFDSWNLSSKISLKDSKKILSDDDEKNNVYIKPHQFILSLTGGYLQPTADLKGDVSKINFNNTATTALSYYENWGYTFGLLGKLSTDKKDRFRVTVSLSLNYFRNTGQDSSGTFTVQPELNFVQIGLGAEWAFMKRGLLVPHIGFDINATSYYGSINIFDDSTGSQISLLYNPVKRFGASVNLGVDYFMSKSFGFTGGIKYSITNLIGKNYDSSGLHDLDDERYVINGVSINKKTISYLNIYVGLSLYIGE